MALIPLERASKNMGTQTLDVKFGDLDPEISWSKGGPGDSSGGPPLGAVWRPMLTWRRVLRTIRTKTLDVSFGDLEPEILRCKGGPGAPTGGPPLGAVWRPMLTWRRVLRTTLLCRALAFHQVQLRI